MLGFLISSVSAAPVKEYPRLSANQSVSNDYEIVKLIDGPIDSLYQLNDQSLFIVQSGDDLWKINTSGEVIDHFNTDDLYFSGLILEKEGFIDWVFTGEKQQKKYGEPIDASGYSDQQLLDAFNQADIVEFIDKDEKGFAYLYQNGKVEMLDISNRREKIDNLVYMSHNIRRQYNLHQDETAINGNRFDGYQKKPGKFSLVEGRGLPAYAAINGYEKIKYHRPYSIANTLFENALGAIFVRNHRHREFGYEVGYSHIDVKFQGQLLKFSVLSDDEYSSGRSHNITWLEPHSIDSSGLKFIVMNYRRNNLAELNELSLLPYYETDVGLYVLRKKTLQNQSTNKPWVLSYSGLHSYAPISGSIQFDQANLTPAYYFFYQRRPIREDRAYFWRGRRANIASPVLKTIPKSLTFSWTDYKDRNFRLLINNRDAWFYNPNDTVVALTLEFDPAEMEQAFKQVGGGNDVAELNINMSEQAYGVELTVHLKNEDEEVRLNNIRFDYQEHPYTPKSPHVAQDKNQTALFSAYEKSIFDFDPDAFLQALNEPAIKDKISSYASPVSYYFARLALHFNVAGRLPENARMMNFYFDKIHPLLNYSRADALQHKNLVVFASQVLHVGISMQDDELAKRAMTNFVDRDFDLETEVDRAFLFNVACYYAVNKNKPQMLRIIRRTITLGRDPESYMKEKDFEHYWQDPDFLQAIKPTAVAP